jgi:hypothetical protein
MRSSTWTALISWLILSLAQATGESRDRSLAYTFENGRRSVVMINITDHRSTPEPVSRVVQLGDWNFKTVLGTVSPTQFDKIWSMFVSSGIEKYPANPAKDKDLEYYYFFATGQHNYAVAKNKASPAIVALTARLEAYAK